jgi:hypothetical protein
LEIRQNAAHVPTRPIAFVIALLALVALAITGWSVVRTNAPPSTGSPAGNSTYTACSGLGPDAQERCILTIQEQQSNAETNHGH